MNIQKGNIIKIGKEKYDVLNVTEEMTDKKLSEVGH